MFSFFDVDGTGHREFVSPGHTVNQKFYLNVLKRLCQEPATKSSREVAQWGLVLAPPQCPHPHSLGRPAVFG